VDPGLLLDEPIARMTDHLVRAPSLLGRQYIHQSFSVTVACSVMLSPRGIFYFDFNITVTEREYSVLSRRVSLKSFENFFFKFIFD
jgi:hypothetical protein